MGSVSRVRLGLRWFVALVTVRSFSGGSVQETQVRSLSREDSPGVKNGNQLSILAWKTPWTEEPERLEYMESRKSRTPQSDGACVHTRMVTLSAPRASDSSRKTLLRIYYFCGFGFLFAMLPRKNLSLATHPNIPHSPFYWILLPWVWSRVASVCSSLKQGFGSQPETEVRPSQWEHWILTTTPSGWRRKWQPTPVFLPGESQGWGSLVGCRLWGHTGSDTAEVT